MFKNLEIHKKVRDVNLTVNDLINFENDIVKHWEDGDIKAPIHLSNGNEKQLLEVFTRISYDDYIFSTWRSHYHALCHGISPIWLKNEIMEGRSITICNLDHNFYSSAIVGGVLPIALGVSIGLKRKNSKQKVWCFVGDMTFETGIFYEMYKYATNFNLPLHFIVEDNDISTNTPTVATWNKKRDIPDDVIYYNYKSKYPHYGTGKWVVF
jgi:pyruvate dehydrogenase E1 component alpha subunit